MYNHPPQEIAQYLLNEGVANTGEIFVDNKPEIDTLPSDYITVVRMINGTPNPRWLRDDITIKIHVIGASNAQTVVSRDHIWSVYNKLLGAYNIELNGYVYFRFISNEMPNFVGYVENGKPLYAASFSFVREAQAPEGNREIIS